MSIENKSEDPFSVAERYLARQGFSAVKLISLLNLYLTSLAAVDGDFEALAQAKPKLSAVYKWTQNIQVKALSGQRIFPPPPASFEQVMLESLPTSVG